MNFKILSDYLLHITHNDADAVGCALAVDKYVELSVYKKYTVQHKFLSVKYANYILNIISDILLTEINRRENNESFNIDKDKLIEYKKITWNYDYDTDVLFIPDTLYITDLSIETSILDKLEKVSKYFNIQVRYVDHHESSRKNNCKYEWCYVETVDNKFKPRAACKLFMDLFVFDNLDDTNGKYPVLENLINDISRYDTWLWKTEPLKYPIEDYTKILIDAYGSAWEAYKHIREQFTNIEDGLHDIPEFSALIQSDRIKRQSYFNRYLPNTVYCMGHELGFNDPNYATAYVALIILPDTYGNDLMEEIYTKSERDIDIVIGLYPASKMFSLRRGKKSKIDLSVLASKYGGGGHSAAAGATCDTDTFMKFLEYYYNLLDTKNNKV